jgi:putative oxidoreductase
VRAVEGVCNFSTGDQISVDLSWLIGARRSTPSEFEQWAAIPLRLIVGYGFLAHGYAKVVNGPDHFFAILHALGVPAPQLMGWATILIELFGGLAVLAGTFVVLASLPMAVTLMVAMFTVHLPYGFSSIKLQAVTATGAQFGQPGYEVDLLYLACLAALVLGGSGPLAVDALLTGKSTAGLLPEQIVKNRHDTH